MAGVTGREAAEAYKRQVKEAIGREASGFYGRYLQLRRKGKRHVALCPFHNERTPSLIVTGKGEFHCFGCGAHGDGIDFLQRRDGLSFPEALAEAGRQVGVVAPQPQRREAERAALGEETRTVYAVRNTAGELLAEHVRLDLPDGGKRFEWWREGKLGLGGIAQGSLPLYGTAEVAAARAAGNNRPVVVCEGEKATEAVRAAGQLALGTYGANVTPTEDALREAGLAETVVVLWPDADEPGRQHMAQVGRALVAVGVAVEVAQWAEALPGADAWDFAQDHTAQELEDMLCQSAVSFAEWVAAAEAEPTKPGPKMQFCTADKLEATLGETTWLWPHWVPYGYVTIVGGEPGCGKSMLLVSLLRTFLHGGQWPDGAPAGDAASATGHRVLWVETDDSQALLKGRLRQMGVDTSRVILPGADGTERADLTKGDVVEEIGQHAAEQGCGLIVVDTLAGAHGLDENSATMRSLMSELAALARSRSLAVVCCHHLRKQGKDEAAAPTMDRLRGSSTISASARSIIGLQPSRKGGAGGEKSVQMEVIKSNLCLAPQPLTFRLSDDGPVFMPGDEGPAQSTKITLTQRAEALLREKLGLGPWPCKQLLEAAQQEGIGSHALYNAAKRVGVVKVAMGRSSVWELPRGGEPETAGEGGETGRGSNESGEVKGSPCPAPG